jgi:hypothetical protein
MMGLSFISVLEKSLGSKIVIKLDLVEENFLQAGTTSLI